MPRILRIINRFNLGGPTFNVAYLSRYLAPEFETMLVGGMKDESEDSSEHILNQLGLKPIIIPEMKREINLVNDWKAYIKIKKLIQEFKPDIVHTHASKAGALGRLAAKACGVPVIVHTFHGHVFHSYFGKIQTAVYKTIERYLAEKSNCIIAISEKQKEELCNEHRICNAEKTQVIRLGFDLQKFRDNQPEKRADFRKKYFIDDDEFVIMIIGRLVPIKNHKLFLDALNYVKQKSGKKIRGFIVGDGEEHKNLESYAGNLGIDFVNGSGKKATLTFTSWIHRADWAIAGSDVIALSSLNEGTPVSLIEAQAAGKPIVTTDAGGVSNVVIPGVTALISEAGQPAEYFKNMLEVITNDSLRNRMSFSGWDHASTNFHYARLVEDTKKLYYHLLEAGK